jgi:hypothetical protein
MKKQFFFLNFLLFWGLLYSSDIQFDANYKTFSLFNKENGKIIKYKLLEPDETMTVSFVKVDTVQIFTRVILNDLQHSFYEYKLRINNEDRIIQKNIKISNKTRGLGGEKVSSYNKHKLILTGEMKNLKLKNVSKMKMLVKLRSNVSGSSASNIDFIRFSPQKSGKEKVVVVNDNDYTYHASDSPKIEFTLEGPILLKIISRLIFESNIINKYKYRFSVFDNDRILATYSEDAIKSKNASLRNNEFHSVSTGDTNIIRLNKGIHHIRIEDNDVNRNLIFRLYISKSAIGIQSYE